MEPKAKRSLVGPQTKVLPISPTSDSPILSPTAAAAATTTSSNGRLLVGSLTFHLCWWVVFAFHVCDFAFLVAMVKLYWWLLNSPDARESLLSNLTFYISYRTLGIMNWFFAFVATLHALSILWIVQISIQARELTFSRVSPPSWMNTKDPSMNESQSVFKLRATPPPVSTATTALVFRLVNKLVVNPWQRVFEHYIVPVFFIRGAHFDDYFLFREYVEAGSQMYQAYYMSHFVATRWINNVFVLMIFLNCVSTPLVHRIVPSPKKPLRRLISLMISALFNFINSVVIPVIIFMPYVRALDLNTLFFSYDLCFQDAWYLNARLENQQLFVTSYVDFITTLTPHWSLFSCLWTCKNMVRLNDPRYTSNGVCHRPCNSVVPHPPSLSKAKSTSNLSDAQRVFKRRKGLVLYNLLWVSGVVVLVIHIVAQLPERIQGCRLQASPWFGTKSSCVVMNVNCYRSGIQGHVEELNRELSKLDTTTLSTLIFSHCANLHVPPIVQTFHGLFGFQIYNCTLREWTSAAELTTTNQPRMDYINILRSRLDTFPEGLLSDHFPLQTWEVDFYDTNLTTLPANLHEKWTNLQTVVFELCNLTEIPSTIYQMRETSLEFRFGGNPIRSIDDRIFELDSVRGLRLFNTSLQEFPKTGASSKRMEQLVMLDLRFTQLTQVPILVRNWYHEKTNKGEYVQHSVIGSPYCLSSRTDELEDIQEQEYRQQACQEDPDLDWSTFPIDLIDPQRQV